MAIDAFFPKITLPKGKTDIRKGEGLGIKYTSENGKVIVMVVDAFEGGEPTRGLIDWLKSIDVKQIDLAVATHAHGDHFGGFYDIAEAGIKIKDFRCYHIDSIREGNSESRKDSDNLLELIRWLQARGTRVLFVDHGDVLEFGDITWHIYRKQPKGPAAKDDPNAWSYVNDGSLVLCSPELSGIIFGDGPAAQKEAIAYFQKKFGRTKFLIWVTVSHHGGHFSMSNAQSARNAGCEFAYESCVERRGPGKEEWTEFGARRLIQNGVTVWMQDENIYIHAAAGKITFKQGSKMLTYDIPYQGKESKVTGKWEYGTKGWWYKYSNGGYATGWKQIVYKGEPCWFLFDDDGWMLTGWRKDDGKWYFLDYKTGVMLKGWHKLPHGPNNVEDWYLLNKSGEMLSGWQWSTKDGKTGWYYLDPDNGMRTGWIYDDGEWYCLGNDGRMLTGWVTYKGRKCYLEPLSDKTHVQGVCYRSRTAVIDGKSYKFDKDGYAEEIAVGGGGKAELNGCDVASYQAGIDFAKMTTTDFAIIKGTQGTWYVNPYADIQYSGAKAAGKLLGMYHYAEGKDPIAEAQYFIRKVGSRVGSCILALDWEGHDNSKFNSDAEVAWVLKFAMEVYRLTKVHIFLYMSKSVTRRRNWAEVAKDVRLWCAQYANQEHTDYKSNPWTDNGGFGAWKYDTIRQYSSKGRVTGYGKDLDINRAYMSRAEWLAAAAGKNTVVATAAKPKTKWSAYVSMTTSPVKISNSGSDENGKYKGGKAGDQTGKEWRIRDWYNYPWNCVLRHPLAEVRACLATMAVKAAENDNIGYDQLQRDDYGIELAKNDYDPSKIKKPVESDCSKGVIDNTKGTGHTLGIPELQSIKATYTGNMRAAYKAAGFYVLTESKYLTSSDYLLAGDILLNDKHHTCTVITNGSKSGDTVVMPLVKKGSTGAAVEQLQEMLIAQGYSCGKWGADGDFGNDTLQAVKSYQRDHGLDVDSEVGPMTWAALIEGSK